MAGLLLNLCYGLLVLLVLPKVLWQRFRHSKYRRGWGQKLAGPPPLPPGSNAGPVIWLHAVSVGEVLQLRQVLARLREARPDARFVVSTTTETGYDVARNRLADCHVIYFPLDFTWSVRGALQTIRPDLIVMVELELWPNFLSAAARRRIPLALINGRLSERSWRGYRRLRPLFARLLGAFDLIAVQSSEYGERFVSLGAPEERVVVTGSIKFDGVETRRDNPQTHCLSDWLQLQPDERVLIAGSTQAPEEEMALRVYLALRRSFPKLRLVLAPRHPERGPEVAALIRAQNLNVMRRSESSEVKTFSPIDPSAPVVGLLDTVGELAACWGLADLAFVGGSFTDRGGQNMLEPAAYGAAVCFGPNTRNFRQVVELLQGVQGAVTIHSEQEWEDFAKQMLHDPQRAAEMGERARHLVIRHQGATQRTVSLLCSILDQSREAPIRRAA